MNMCLRLIISIHAPPRGATPAAAQALLFRHNFNSRPSARGDRRRQTGQSRRYKFQFTPLREGRQGNVAVKPLTFYFNSRPSARGDERAAWVEPDGRISIHAPPRGATLPGLFQVANVPFQFTPLREGRPLPRSSTRTRGLFQFTPLREGRRPMYRVACVIVYFNSRPSARGDAQRLPCGNRREISIHAPPRGATAERFLSVASCTFQFTPLREGRRFMWAMQFSPNLFQFTPLREGRRALFRWSLPRIRFQFTPLREGRLVPFCVLFSFILYFNSRPSARGDKDWSPPLARWINFNSRPSARGDRGEHDAAGPPMRISIHAPPRGATHRIRHYLRYMDISIHAPPRGATAKDMQFLQIFCSTLTNQHGLTIVPRNLSRLFW